MKQLALTAVAGAVVFAAGWSTAIGGASVASANHLPLNQSLAGIRRTMTAWDFRR